MSAAASLAICIGLLAWALLLLVLVLAFGDADDLGAIE